MIFDKGTKSFNRERILFFHHIMKHISTYLFSSSNVRETGYPHAKERSWTLT